MLVTDAVALCDALDEAEAIDHDRDIARREADAKAWADFGVKLMVEHANAMSRTVAAMGAVIGRG